MAQRRGDASTVAALCHECLLLQRELGNRSQITDCYELLTWLASERG